MENKGVSINVVHKIDITRLNNGNDGVIREICAQLEKIYEYEKRLLEKEAHPMTIFGVRVIIINNSDDYYKGEFKEGETMMMHHKIFIINKTVTKDIKTIKIEHDITKPKEEIYQKEQRIFEVYALTANILLKHSKRLLSDTIKDETKERITILVKHMIMQIDQVCIENKEGGIQVTQNYNKSPIMGKNETKKRKIEEEEKNVKLMKLYDESEHEAANGIEELNKNEERDEKNDN